MRALAVFVLLGPVAAASPWDERVRAFFAAEGPHELAEALARLDVPSLAGLPFGQAWVDGAPAGGWVEADGRLRTGLFAVRRFEGAVVPLHRHAALHAMATQAEPPASELFAHWVAALQEDDGKGARRAWTLLARRAPGAGLRRLLLRALAREWPLAWEQGQRRDGALRALRAMEALAAEGYWRAYVARRLAYVRECADAVPDPPGDDASPERAVRLWVEGLRRMGPLYSCLIGTPPHFYGEPDAYEKLKEIGAAAYPVLVVAAEDPRTAGRGVSLGAEGEPSHVGFVASCLLQEMLPYREDPEALERWIQAGAWRDARATALWFARHGTRPGTLVEAAAALRGDPDAAEALRALGGHASAPVRIAASAALGEWSGLARRADDVAGLDFEDSRFNRMVRSPEGAAVRLWASALAGHGERGWCLLGARLAEAGPGARTHLIGAVVRSGAGPEAVPFLAPYLDDPSANVRLLTAIVLGEVSGGAFGSHADDEALIAAARTWTRTR